MQRICVFAGSNKGARPEYAQAAQSLGQELVRRGIGLVYGGASVGLMGIVADSVMTGGGEVIGVIPHVLVRKEVGHKNLTQLHEVNSMHERKAMMADLADGFIALPGGFGTFDELFEIVTWAQLGLHQKPIGLVNSASYFDPVLQLLQHAATEGFLQVSKLDLVLLEAEPSRLLDRFASSIPAPVTSKWSDLPTR
jgi:uncharacterized protein (TIGR00730 family)